MLERLRPRRGDAARVPPDTAHATVVLKTLSGRGRKPAWPPPLLSASLIILAGIAILLYVANGGRVSRAPGGPSLSNTGLPVPRTSSVNTSQSPGGNSAGDGARTGAARARRDSTHGAQTPSVEVAPGSQPKASRPDAASGAAAPAVTTGAAAAEKRPAGTVEPNEPGDAEDHFRRALYYHRSGDFENALMQYTLVLESNEMHVQAHNNLGLLYQGKGSLNEAIREFTKAIGIDPSYAQARNNLGVALLQAGNVDAAIAEFQSLLRADARNVGAMVNLAIALRAARHPGEAQETLIRAISIDGRSAAAHYNLASLYEDAGEFAKALEYYERYLTLAGADEAKRMADVRQRCQILRQRIMQQ